MTLRKEAPTFRVRCSALGQLMTPARSKSEILSETAKQFIVLWYKEQLYNRRKEIMSKYLTKGTSCEDESIAYINRVYDTEYTKNEEYFSNDYLHGTPDIVTSNLIIDIKNSWDFSTFPLFSQSIPNKDYVHQVQGYMMLTGKRNGSVIYTLIDLPDDQIEQEWRRSGNTGLVSPEFKAQYRYTGLPDELRIKRFDFEYSSELETQIIDKIEAARQFIQTLRY